MRHASMSAFVFENFFGESTQFENAKHFRTCSEWLQKFCSEWLQKFCEEEAKKLRELQNHEKASKIEMLGIFYIPNEHRNVF